MQNINSLLSYFLFWSAALGPFETYNNDSSYSPISIPLSRDNEYGEIESYFLNFWYFLFNRRILNTSNGWLSLGSTCSQLSPSCEGGNLTASSLMYERLSSTDPPPLIAPFDRQNRTTSVG